MTFSAKNTAEEQLKCAENELMKPKKQQTLAKRSKSLAKSFEKQKA